MLIGIPGSLTVNKTPVKDKESKIYQQVDSLAKIGLLYDRAPRRDGFKKKSSLSVLSNQMQ